MWMGSKGKKLLWKTQWLELSQKFWGWIYIIPNDKLYFTEEQEAKKVAYIKIKNNNNLKKK